MEQLHINCTNCTMTAGQPNAKKIQKSHQATAPRHCNNGRTKHDRILLAIFFYSPNHGWKKKRYSHRTIIQIIHSNFTLPKRQLTSRPFPYLKVHFFQAYTQDYLLIRILGNVCSVKICGQVAEGNYFLLNKK